MSEIDFKKLARQMSGREKISGSMILIIILLFHFNVSKNNFDTATTIAFVQMNPMPLKRCW